MTAQLYCFGESGNAYKAALTMELAGYDWQPVYVDFFNGETRSPAFREINEMGEVPVFREGDLTLTQSAVIQYHVAEKTGKFLAEDRAEQQAWMGELRRVGLLGADVDEEDVILGLYRYLGRTPSRLLALSLADAVGDRRAQNQPGTTDEYPNWRVPLTDSDGDPVLVEHILTDPRAAALAEALRVATAPQPD